MAYFAAMTTRQNNNKQTIGRLQLFDEEREIFSCVTLELPWRNNENNVSCIPAGEYVVKHRYSEEYGYHFHVTDVEGRSYILIHAANYYTDLRGCIAVGGAFADINKDGLKDVINSRQTLADFVNSVPRKEDFTLNINRL